MSECRTNSTESIFCTTVGYKMPSKKLWMKPNAKQKRDGCKISYREDQGMLVVYKKECFARINSHSLWVINVPSKQSVLFGDCWIS